MPKTKEQKQIEAAWRKVRGDLITHFGRGTDEKVLRDWGEYGIEQREAAWAAYLALPRHWRDIALDGVAVPGNLAARLRLEAVEQEARDIQKSTAPATAAMRRVRI